MTFVLTAATTPGTPSKLLGVDASNNAIAVTPPLPSTGLGTFNVEIGNISGSALTTGLKTYFRATEAGIYSSWAVIGDAAGSVNIDVWKKPNAVPTVADIITNNTFVLTTQQLVNSATFSGISAGFFAAGDIFAINLTSVSTFKWLRFQLTYARTS